MTMYIIRKIEVQLNNNRKSARDNARVKIITSGSEFRAVMNDVDDNASNCVTIPMLQ